MGEYRNKQYPGKKTIEETFGMDKERLAALCQEYLTPNKDKFPNMSDQVMYIATTTKLKANERYAILTVMYGGYVMLGFGMAPMWHDPMVG